MHKRKICFFLSLCLFLVGCTSVQSPAPAPIATTPDRVIGMWISFLELDSVLEKGDVTAAETYIDTVMETCKKDGFNTVFFHVRAHGDAYYPSAVFPPAKSVRTLLEAGFDPLAYAVQSAHNQNLSFHAWINPYRIGEDRSFAQNEDVFSAEDVWYYIPSSLSAQKLIIDGVRELVETYPVDGIQFDDYFYPPSVSPDPMPFETVPNGVSVKDYRQGAVNGLLSAVFQVVHIREGCLFGVSPAGNITYSAEKLYADPAWWLQYDGYIDYLCPQLYSGFENETLPFSAQAQTYASLPRAKGVRLYGGLALYKTGEMDAFAGKGQNEWKENNDILTRQTKLLLDTGYDGVSLFRYAHWTGEKSEIRAQEISAFSSYS
jgi:uncharacterized lipoprotein YddW (UPF0748 family)